MTSDQRAVASVAWYYSVEVEPGMYTSGLDYANISVTRKLLRAVSYRDHDCLDIGSMEGLVPALLKRGGARRVVACDGRDLSARVALVQRAHGVEFEYVAGVDLQHLPAVLDARGARYFDLVVFSGVLYHLLNPLGLLATVRGFCKIGGLIVVETAAIQHPEEKLYFNARGDLYGVVDNYFIPTTAWLDYVLRMLGLVPLEMAYIGSQADSSLNRVAVLCRSVASPCALRPGDRWPDVPEHQGLFAIAGQIDWTALRQTSSQISRVTADPAASCEQRSIYDAIRACGPHAFTIDETRLSFSSTM